MTCSLKLSVVSILFPVLLYCVSAANAATSIFEISSSTELRSLISSYNIYNSGSPLPPNLVDNRDDFVFSIQNDIIFESYNAGTLTQVGNAVPFIRPYWPINIIIDGNGHTLSRSASAENLFRFLGVFGTVSPPPGNRTVKANVTLKNITLSGFELSGFEGGALFVGRDAEVTLKDVTFANNMVQPSASNPDEPVKGGAVYVGTRGDLKIASSTIKNNSASFGGAIASENASILILHSDISNNSAEKGGGFYISGGSFNIVDSSVSNNTATEAGGGLFADFFNTSAIRRSTFGNNAGGGLVANGVGAASNILEILTSTFSGNTNPSGGGAFEISNGQTSIENSTVTNNQGTSAINIADWSGTGFSKSISVRNSILSGNTTNSALSGFSEINCSEPNIEINGGLNLIGDDRFTQSQGLGGNCLLDTSVGANLLAFSDGDQAKRITEILKPLADNGCCKSNSICIDNDGKKDGVGSMANLICPETHGLTYRSPAIDVFRSFTGEFAFKYVIDQRGILSMPGPGETFNYTDLGAFEGYLPDDENCYVINTKNEKVVVFCL